MTGMLVPGGQGRAAVSPVALQWWPLGQGEQSLAATRPVELPKVPFRHSLLQPVKFCAAKMPDDMELHCPRWQPHVTVPPVMTIILSLPSALPTVHWSR